MNLPAGSFSSWFRVAPSLATLTSIASGDALCAAGPAVGTNLFPAGTAATVTAPTPPVTPTPVSTSSTGTGVYCFAYSGLTTAVTSFGTRFAGAVTAVNRWNLPDGKFNNWFAAAPSLSTIKSLNNGDVISVSAPVGTSVFITPPAAPTNVQATIASWTPATCTITVDVTWQDNSNNETGFYVGPPSGPAAGFAGFARPSANATSAHFSYTYAGGTFPVFVWAVIQTPSQLVFSNGDPSGVILTPSPAASCP